METEKHTVTRRFRRLRQIGRLLRCLEVAGVLLLLSYSSAYLPAVARNSGEFFRRATTVLVSPTFVFLLGNAIVVVLFAKSGNIASSPESASAVLPVVNESGDICFDLSTPPPPHLGPAEEVVFEDKAVCFEIRACRSESFEQVKQEPKVRRTEEEVGLEEGKSPPLSGLPEAAAAAAAEIDGKGIAVHDKAEAADGEEDAEQFRRTIEEFIAKQQRFRRQESLAVVSCSAGITELVAV